MVDCQTYIRNNWRGAVDEAIDRPDGAGSVPVEGDFCNLADGILVTDVDARAENGTVSAEAEIDVPGYPTYSDTKDTAFRLLVHAEYAGETYSYQFTIADTTAQYLPLGDRSGLPGETVHAIPAADENKELCVEILTASPIT